MRLPVALGVLAALCLVGGSVTMWPLLEHLGLTLACVVAVSWIMAYFATRAVSVTRDQLPSHATVGEVLDVTFRIRSGVFPALRVAIVTADDPTGEHRAGAWRGGEGSVVMRRAMARRGHHALGDATVYVDDPLGIFRFRCAELAPQVVTVYPHPIPVPAAGLPTMPTQGSHHRWRLSSADGTVGDLRPYVVGDPPARIHWKSTARTGALMVTDPETHRPLTVWLLAHLGAEGAENEHVPGVTAYLAQTLLDSGLTVGLIAVGTDIATISAVRGLQQRSRILEALACTPSSRAERLATLLHAAARCPSPGKMILITRGIPNPTIVRELRRFCPDVQVLNVAEVAV